MLNISSGYQIKRAYDKNGKPYILWDWVNAYQNAVKDGHQPYNMDDIQIILMISVCGMANKLIIETTQYAKEKHAAEYCIA